MQVKRRELSHKTQLLTAISRSASYGKGWDSGPEPRGYGAPRPKTGRFTGYWDSGVVQWQGSFYNGQKQGVWRYFSQEGACIHTQIYMNL
jgi:hypothetical protein